MPNGTSQIGESQLSNILPIVLIFVRSSRHDIDVYKTVPSCAINTTLSAIHLDQL